MHSFCLVYYTNERFALGGITVSVVFYSFPPLAGSGEGKKYRSKNRTGKNEKGNGQDKRREKLADTL